MRNLLKILTVFAFLVGNVFILSGCDDGGGGGGDEADVNVVGTWKGVDLSTGQPITVTFNANGTVVGRGTYSGSSGTYVVNGNSITGSVNGGTFSGTVNGNTMEITDHNGYTARLTRQ